MTWLSLVLVVLLLFGPGWGLAGPILGFVMFPSNVVLLLIITLGLWGLITGFLLLVELLANLQITNHPLSDVLFKRIPEVTLRIARWLAWVYLIVNTIGIALSFVPYLSTTWDLNWSAIILCLFILVGSFGWHSEQRRRYATVIDHGRLERRSVQRRIKISSTHRR